MLDTLFASLCLTSKAKVICDGNLNISEDSIRCLDLKKGFVGPCLRPLECAELAVSERIKLGTSRVLLACLGKTANTANLTEFCSLPAQIPAESKPKATLNGIISMKSMKT